MWAHGRDESLRREAQLVFPPRTPSAMAAVVATELGDDLEELQLDYEEQCDEVVDLQHELRAARMEAQQLRLRLQAAGQRKGAAACLPHPAVGAEVRRVAELRSFLSWLGQSVDAAEEDPAALSVGFEVTVGEHSAHMDRVVQWPLRTHLGRRPLLLTSPVRHQDAVSGMLAAARRISGDEGRAAATETECSAERPAGGAHSCPSACPLADEEALQRFAAEWELVAGDLSAAGHCVAEPVVMLARRCPPSEAGGEEKDGEPQEEGILISSWPTSAALQAFDALYSTVEGPRCRPGDRVSVQYEGEWFAGTLYAVDTTGKASVRCDVDGPGVLTLSPLYHVKRLPAAPPGDATGCGPQGASAPEEEGDVRTRAATSGGVASSATAAADRSAAKLAQHRRTKSAM